MRWNGNEKLRAVYHSISSANVNDYCFAMTEFIAENKSYIELGNCIQLMAWVFVYSYYSYSSLGIVDFLSIWSYQWRSHEFGFCQCGEVQSWLLLILCIRKYFRILWL